MRNLTAIAVLLFAAVSIAAGGCATQQPETPAQQAQRIEPMLAAAGFHVLPADNPTRVAQLQSLTPLKMRFFPHNGKMHYWYADPYYCNCIYSGGEKAYGAFEGIKLQQRMANEQEMSAQMNEDAAAQENMNFTMWPANEVFFGD